MAARVARIVLVAALACCVALIAGCSAWQGAVLYGSGTGALDRGEVFRAVDDLERAAALVPQASEIQNHLGLAYTAAGRDDDALVAFQRAVDLDCENVAAQRNLSKAERAARSSP